jgi:hypothetical protein
MGANHLAERQAVSARHWLSPCYVAEDPLSCVAIGTGLALEYFDDIWDNLEELRAAFAWTSRSAPLLNQGETIQLDSGCIQTLRSSLSRCLDQA